MAETVGESGGSGKPGRGEVDPVIAALADHLRTLTEDFEVKVRRFGESIDKLELAEAFVGLRKQFQEIVAKDIHFTRQFGENIEKVKEHDIVRFEELTAISEDFLRRVRRWGKDLDGFGAWKKEFEGLIGAGTTPSGFNLLLNQYMDQINVFAGIVKQFSDKVKACEICMDVEKYETLIKSYGDILTTWGTLVKNVEDLLKSKAELVYNTQENEESLLKSYEDLIKSGLEIEDMRLDLRNKPLRKDAEHAKNFEELAKSIEDLLKSLIEVLSMPVKTEEELLKSLEDLIKSLGDLVKILLGFGIQRPQTASAEDQTS